jgi:aryl-alcohol dehydrogenase-like predicted oxidoreductase
MTRGTVGREAGDLCFLWVRSSRDATVRFGRARRSPRALIGARTVQQLQSNLAALHVTFAEQLDAPLSVPVGRRESRRR